MRLEPPCVGDLLRFEEDPVTLKWVTASRTGTLVPVSADRKPVTGTRCWRSWHREGKGRPALLTASAGRNRLVSSSLGSSQRPEGALDRRSEVALVRELGGFRRDGRSPRQEQRRLLCQEQRRLLCQEQRRLL